MLNAIDDAMTRQAEEQIREDAFDEFQRAVQGKNKSISFDREWYLTVMRRVFTHEHFFLPLNELNPSLTAETGIERGSEWQKYRIARFLLEKLRAQLATIKIGPVKPAEIDEDPEEEVWDGVE